MLKISESRLAQLDARAQTSFEDRVLAILERWFPERVEDLGDEHARVAIRYATNSAAKYELASERNIAYYTVVMLLFGRDFDLDPRLPWAAEILRKPGLGPDQRASALYEVAQEDLDNAMEAGA